MTRCQHCNKLTHNEHLNVYVNASDMDKLHEISRLTDWLCAWQYNAEDAREWGTLKCGDIRVHFIVIKDEEMPDRLPAFRGLKCYRCDSILELVKAVPPWTVDHYQCCKCDSTYSIGANHEPVI